MSWPQASSKNQSHSPFLPPSLPPIMIPIHKQKTKCSLHHHGRLLNTPTPTPPFPPPPQPPPSSSPLQPHNHPPLPPPLHHFTLFHNHSTTITTTLTSLSLSSTWHHHHRPCLHGLQPLPHHFPPQHQPNSLPRPLHSSLHRILPLRPPHSRPLRPPRPSHCLQLQVHVFPHFLFLIQEHPRPQNLPGSVLPRWSPGPPWQSWGSPTSWLASQHWGCRVQSFLAPALACWCCFALFVWEWWWWRY